MRNENLLGDTEKRFREWRERGMFESTEQRVCDQVRAIRKIQTDRFNEAIKYLKSKSITETYYFIRAASVWVAEQIGVKKAEHRKKNEPR